jgi:archaellum component FlaC
MKDHLTEIARPLISEELEELLHKLSKKLLQRFLESQESMQEDFGKFRDELNAFKKQLDDLQIQVDTIDTRTQQIKRTGDELPKITEQTINKGMDKKQKELLKAVDTQLENTPTKPFKKKRFKFIFWK